MRADSYGLEDCEQLERGEVVAVLTPKTGLSRRFLKTIHGLWSQHDVETDPKLKAFLVFHRDNPHIYESFVHYMRFALGKGKKKLGIAQLTERVRWDLDMETESQDPFKINNNHRAYYARLIMHKEGVPGLFEVRKQHK